ncbi:MAG TPA: protein kinase [Tepidisphaeraceae bacterium]|jgi:serine/threonine protein kinase/Leucine-rich repeat (LRR) protein|nr:protein kinase [Tepidisphaeraceae bacterium]
MRGPSTELPGAHPISVATSANAAAEGTSEFQLQSHPEERSALPRLEGYVIRERLGEGGMGVVWKAVQLSTKRTVAVKLMSAASFGSERARLRFEREVELTASLDHPHIARVFDSGVRDGVFFYSMEWIDGLPLDEHVKKHQLSRRQTLLLMERVCAAVQHAHQKGVIHRDLKPSNILVDKEGQPHVLDFGLAKFTQGGDRISLDGEIAGTPPFMSPEQAAGRVDEVDTRSDVYTLGVMLFHLLSGQYPHDHNGSNIELLRRIAEEEPRRIRDIQPKIDADLATLLGHTLEREPEGRYAAAGALAADLHRYLSGDPVSARPPSPAYRLRKRIRKHRKSFAFGSVIVALILSIAGYAAYDYYAQWGDWIKVADHDFTSANASPDGLEFIGGSNEPSPYKTTAWKGGGDGLRGKRAEWCVLKDVHVRGDVRVVVNVAFGSQPEGFEICLNSGTFGFACPPGYSAEVGGYQGQVSFISRNERIGWPDMSEAISTSIRPGRVAAITFERQGELLTLQVDKEPPIRSTQLVPLTGVGLDGVAVRAWSNTTVIRSITVYRRSLPKKANPVIAGDALVEAGDLAAALRQYENLADDYPHSATGEIALSRAGSLAGTIRPMDAARMRRLVDRFTREYPHSWLRRQLMESQVLGIWQDGRFDQALEKLEIIRRSDSQTRLPLRLVAAARLRKGGLPPNIAKKLMACVRQVPDVGRLNVTGLGIESLADIVRPELRHLECSDNPIRSLEPLRGSMLQNLRCNFTEISSLEPLRGHKLRVLNIVETSVSDLDPIRGMPLSALVCDHCPITSLEPLRGMATLTMINFEGTSVSSLDPLTGLPLKQVSIGRTFVRDLNPLEGMPLEKLDIRGCEIAGLDAVRGAPLISLRCDENRIESLEPLRGMNIHSLKCSSNRIRSLDPLRGMPLQELRVFDNPLTSLEPLVENPPAHFWFDCDSLPDAELERVREIWSKRPEHRRHSRDAALLLALRHGDVSTLRRLATSFDGHRYLLAPHELTWEDASRLCRSLGGHLVTIASPEENAFLTNLCRDCDREPWIGLRRTVGHAAWETGESVSFSALSLPSVFDHRDPGTNVSFARGDWILMPDRYGKLNPFIIEWD